MSEFSLKNMFISQEATLYGIYPASVLEFDGNVRPTPISIVQD